MKISQVIAIISSLIAVGVIVVGIQFYNGSFDNSSGGNETSTNNTTEEDATHKEENTTDKEQDTTETVNDESGSDAETTGECQKEDNLTDESTSQKTSTTKKPVVKTTAKKITTQKVITTEKVTTTKSTTIAKPTTTKKSTTTATATASRVTGFESEMLTIINQYRDEVGAPHLTTTTALNNAAAARAKETIEKFDHTRPDGSSCFTILSEFNISYRTCGENIAWGQRNVSSVMTAWYNSSGHKKNMQNADFGHVGFGCYTYNGTRYWVQIFTD